MKKLTLIQIISVSMMLFAIFFGAGNMIFPPAMGQLAGTSYISALAGFILTDAGIAILGVTAVVLAGTSMSDLGNLVSRRFALVLSVGVYLLIGKQCHTMVIAVYSCLLRTYLLSEQQPKQDCGCCRQISDAGPADQYTGYLYRLSFTGNKQWCIFFWNHDGAVPCIC